MDILFPLNFGTANEDSLAMINDPFWNASPAPPCKARQPESVWSLRKDGQYFDAKLLSRGEYGWECQIFFNGEFLESRRWHLKAEALRQAEEKRSELEKEGWRLAEH
jgi:hypothetical protein